MRFKDLVAECVYSFERLHVTEEQFNAGGLTAIIGQNKDQDTANGAGKTSILKVIYYLLFGKDLDGTPIEEISNRNLGRGHFGQLIFEDKGNEFKIQRYVDFKPTKNSLIQVKDGSRAKLKGIRFYINGEVFGDKKPNGEPTSDAEIKKIILDRIGMTPELFLMSVMTAQDSDSNFLTASDTRKKEIISELLDLEVYEGAYDVVKGEIDEKEKQISQAESQVEEINREAQTKDQEIIALKAKEEGFKREIDKELTAIESQFIKAEQEYKTLKKAKPDVSDTIQIENQLKEKEKELKLVPEDSLTLETDEIKVLDEQTSECDGLLRKIEGDTSRIQGQLQFLNAELKKKTGSKESIQAEIDALKSCLNDSVNLGESESLSAQALEASAKVAPIDASLAEQNSLYRSSESKLNQISGQLQILKADNDKKFSLKEKLTAEVTGLREQANETDLNQPAGELKSLLERATEQILKVEKEKTEIEYSVRRVSDEIKKLESSENCPTCNRPWDKEHQAEREANLTSLKNKLSEQNDQIKNLTAALALETENKKKYSAAIRILEIEAEIKALEASLATVESLEKEAERKLQEVSVIGEAIRSLESDKELAQNLVKEITLKIEKIKQFKAAKERAEALNNELSSLVEIEEQIALLKSSSEEMSGKAAKVRAVSNSLMKKKNEELDRIRGLMRESQEKRAKLNQEIKELGQSLAQAQMSAQKLVQWESSLASAYEKLQMITKHAEAIQSRPNPYVELMERVEERKVELKDRRETVTARIEKIQDDLKYLQFWKNGFGPTGIRSFISDEVVVHLNEIVREYLNDLFDGAISAVFESESVSQKGGVSNKISTKFYLNGKETPFGLLSGGEKQRIVLAVDLALSDIAESRTGTKINLKFMDEPFNGIDGNGQLKSIALFSKIANRKNGFFIITHDQSFQALCQNTIYVVKDREISEIVTKDKFREAS